MLPANPIPSRPIDGSRYVVGWLRRDSRAGVGRDGQVGLCVCCACVRARACIGRGDAGDDFRDTWSLQRYVELAMQLNAMFIQTQAQLQDAIAQLEKENFRHARRVLCLSTLLAHQRLCTVAGLRRHCRFGANRSSINSCNVAPSDVGMLRVGS